MIKMKLVKYNLDANEEPEKYQAIQAAAKALGHKLMDAWHPSTRHDWLDRLPDEVTIEPAHLFADQYNTAEGFRVHDWYEEIYWRDNGTRTPRKKGYYLIGDNAELNAVKANRYHCNYCGKQYEKENAPQSCPSCIGSQYMTEERLPMLLVRPLMEKFDGIEKAPAELIQLWHELQPELKKQRAAAELERLKVKGIKVLADAKKKGIELMEEANVLSQLLTNGIDTDNLIYYSHTKKWCFGWRQPMSAAEVLDIEARLRSLPCGEFLLSTVEFKQTKG